MSDVASMINEFYEVASPDVSDALDVLGLQGQTVGVVPLWDACRKIVGPALTVKLTDGGPGSTTLGTLEALAAAAPGAGAVLDNGGRLHINSWGSIAAYCASRQGVVGCVIDGATRDLAAYKKMDFPVYARGVVQVSVRNRTGFAGYNIPIEFCGVTVQPGDLVVADEDGVVFVPRDRIEEVLHYAKRAVVLEERIKREIDAGVAYVEAHQRQRYEESSSER
jgi:regulator of RNase E activity RraA